MLLPTLDQVSHVPAYTYASPHMHAYACTQIHANVRAHTHACTRMHVHAFTHTHHPRPLASAAASPHTMSPAWVSGCQAKITTTLSSSKPLRTVPSRTAFYTAGVSLRALSRGCYVPKTPLKELQGSQGAPSYGVSQGALPLKMCSKHSWGWL